MVPIRANFVDNAVDMILIRLAQLGTHITLKNEFMRGTCFEVGDKFGLILFGAVVGRFEIDTLNLLAMVHTHHLFDRIGQKVFLDGDIPPDKFKCHGGGQCPY